MVGNSTITRSFFFLVRSSFGLFCYSRFTVLGFSGRICCSFLFRIIYIIGRFLCARIISSSTSFSVLGISRCLLGKGSLFFL